MIRNSMTDALSLKNDFVDPMAGISEVSQNSEATELKQKLKEIDRFVWISRRGEEGASYMSNRPLLDACDHIEYLLAAIKEASNV